MVRALLRASAALALQYRLEFIVEGVLALFWQGVTLIPLWVVFGKRRPRRYVTTRRRRRTPRHGRQTRSIT